MPRTVREATKLDEQNNNTDWIDAVNKEIDLFMSFDVFEVLPYDQSQLEEYNKIPLVWAFSNKFDGRKRARGAGGGHVTDDITYDLYSGVVQLESVKCAFLAAELYNLDTMCADVTSAYLLADTTEKVYLVAGPEFGKLQGRVLKVKKALYGLKTSGG